jgi:hypothetical protein
MQQHTDTRDLPRLRKANRVTTHRRRPHVTLTRPGEEPNSGRRLRTVNRYADAA